MTQAIFEIASMLLGALAIGVYFTYRHWKAQYEAVVQSNQTFQDEAKAQNEKLGQLKKEKDQQETDHQNAMQSLEAEKNEAIATLEKNHDKETKKLKVETKAANKALKEDKALLKEATDKIKALELVIEIKEEQLGEKERELEEVTQHLHTHKVSYYKQIDGKRYKAVTLAEADQAIAGIGDGRISKADAEKIFATISDGHKYTQVEKDTMHYIREHYKWTPESDELFRKKVRSWAAKGHQLD